MCEFQILHLSRLTCTFFPELRSLLHFDFIASETNRVNKERDISVLLKCLNRDSRTEAFYWANTKVCIPSTQLKYLLFVFVYVRLCTYTLYHTIPYYAVLYCTVCNQSGCEFNRNLFLVALLSVHCFLSQYKFACNCLKFRSAKVKSFSVSPSFALK